MNNLNWFVVALLLCLLPETGHTKKSGPVIDLGSDTIEGDIRGPQMQIIEAPELDRKASAQIYRFHLRQTEAHLLQRLRKVVKGLEE